VFVGVNEDQSSSLLKPCIGWKFGESARQKINEQLWLLLLGSHNIRKRATERRIAEFGLDKFCEFTNIVHKMSDLVVQFLEKDYFGSGERVEMSHLFVWMLGCIEYGLLNTSSMEVGNYDHLSDKYSSYLREEFSKKE